MTLYFEDVVLGEDQVLGSYTFRAEEIKQFAGRYDPQTFHLDEAAAAKPLFGGLCDSGWHTAAVWMKLLVSHSYSDHEGPEPRFGPSPGFRDLKWLKPVYAGDTITYRTRNIETKALASKPNWGLLESLNEGHNQDGALVFSFISQVFLRRRESTRID